MTKINPNMRIREKQPLKLISARDPRVLTAIAPFDDSMLVLEGYKDREELSRDMFEFMISNGGIGLQLIKLVYLTICLLQVVTQK